MKTDGTAGFDWTMTALSALFLGGVFLDGWAHTHGRVDTTFFTPWHAVLYAGYAASALFLVGALIRNVARGARWQRGLPAGYGLSLVGAGLWLFGGPFDLVWHALFGFEVSVEALLSPAHFVLALGAALIFGGPLRAARRRGKVRGVSQWLPLLLSVTFVLSELTFFTQIAHPLANLWGAAGTPVAHVSQELGIVSILFTTAVLMGAVLVLLRGPGLPSGAVTLVFGVNAVAMGLLYDQGDYPLAPVLAFVVGGLAADGLRALLTPSVARPHALRLFAAAVPMALHLLYFGSLALRSGLGWSVHLWVGTIVFSGVVGWLLSYVALDAVSAPAIEANRGWAPREAGRGADPVLAEESTRV